MARLSGAEVPEVILPLGFSETRNRLLQETGYHTVPVLVSNGAVIRDSLAITETLAEDAPPAMIWPEAPLKRAFARSIVAEMHSGFLALRAQMPVDIRSRKPRPPIVGDLKNDIQRVLQIWQRARDQFAADGPFLLGQWCAADAFYAPVVTRFRTYGVSLEGAPGEYADAVWSHPAMLDLADEAACEPWEIEVGPTGPIRAWIRE